MKILFRTSGGRAYKKELGLGHVYRCINLASQLKSHELHFLIEDYGGVKKILNSYRFKNISLLKKNVCLYLDIKQTIQYIKSEKINIIIVDKYKVKLKYLSEMRKFVKVVFVSDLKNIEYPADLVVNGFIGFENKIFVNRYDTKCLLGPSYQILNKNYEKRRIIREKKYDLLATFGGFDKSNVIEFLLKILSKYIGKIKIKIILGPATHKSKEIKVLEKKYRIYLKIIQQTYDMQKEISNVKFGICGGGITTYEFASMGVPFAIICQYQHQLITAREWEDRGIAINLGRVNNNLQKNIKNFLDNILYNKIHYKLHQKCIVDGLGAKRVAREILKL